MKKVIKIIKNIFQIVVSGLALFFVWVKFFKPEKKDKQIEKEMKDIEKNIKDDDKWLADNKSYRDSLDENEM